MPGFDPVVAHSGTDRLDNIEQYMASNASQLLFDQTLSGTAASIDPGANSIPAGFKAIQVLFTGATNFPAVAVTTTAAGLQINGDGGANYYYESLLDANAVYGGANNQASPDTGVIRINMPGASAGAGSVCYASAIFHNYDNTNWNKACILHHMMFDPTAAANGRCRTTIGFWNSTAAITQISVLTKTNLLLANSRLTIWGIK